MAIKTNSMTIPETGVTLSNAYSKIESYSVRKQLGLPDSGNSDIHVDVQVAHYANSSSRAANKQPVQYKHITVIANELTGSMASGSFTILYDKLKLIAPFSGSTISDV